MNLHVVSFDKNQSLVFKSRMSQEEFAHVLELHEHYITQALSRDEDPMPFPIWCRENGYQVEEVNAYYYEL